MFYVILLKHTDVLHVKHVLALKRRLSDVLITVVKIVHIFELVDKLKCTIIWNRWSS